MCAQLWRDGVVILFFGGVVSLRFIRRIYLPGRRRSHYNKIVITAKITAVLRNLQQCGDDDYDDIYI